jgi:hypothetical protein
MVRRIMESGLSLKSKMPPKKPIRLTSWKLDVPWLRASKMASPAKPVLPTISLSVENDTRLSKS